MNTQDRKSYTALKAEEKTYCVLVFARPLGKQNRGYCPKIRVSSVSETEAMHTAMEAYQHRHPQLHIDGARIIHPVFTCNTSSHVR